MVEEIKHQHEAVFDEIITRDQYRVKYQDFKGKNVIDIGASNGVFTLLAHDYGAKSIISIEPNTIVFKILKENVKSYSNIKAYNLAVWSESGKKVNIGREAYFADIDARCYVVPNDNGEIRTCNINTFFQLFKNDKDVVLKLDCEGSEYEILYSMNVSYFNKVSTIFLEAHENIGGIAPKEKGSIQKLVNYIKSFGFNEVYHENYVGQEVQLFKFEKIKLEDSITVLINGFLRLDNIKLMVEALRNQTIQPNKIIVYYTKPTKDFIVPFIDNVDFIVAEEDHGLPSRFAIGLITKTNYLCIMDDDMVPGNKWLEICLDLIKKENAVICGYGMKYNNSMSDLNARRFGDHGESNEKPEQVDVGGHSWFMKKEWLKYFWMEDPIDWKVSDDIHFAYTLKKYGNLKIIVSPHPVSDKTIWSNTMLELGMGTRSLHARKEEDVNVWKNPVEQNQWEMLPYLQDNLNKFINKRQVIMNKYIELGWEIK